MNKNIQEDLSSNCQEKKSNNIYDESGDLEFKDLTEVDIFSSKYGFDDSFVEKMLNPKTKWNEKKQAFDNLTECTDQSRLKYIKNTDRSNFIDMVKKLLKQPNINVRIIFNFIELFKGKKRKYYKFSYKLFVQFFFIYN